MYTDYRRFDKGVLSCRWFYKYADREAQGSRGIMKNDRSSLVRFSLAVYCETVWRIRI
jgi:hypothetical protein